MNRYCSAAWDIILLQEKSLCNHLESPFMRVSSNTVSIEKSRRRIERQHLKKVSRPSNQTHVTRGRLHTTL